MNMLIDQMLDTARIEDSRLQLSRQRVDLGSLVSDVLDSTRVLVGADHSIVLEPRVAGVTVFADRSRTQTIVGNLIDNAVKYSPDGGEVRCVVRVEGRDALVEVSDPGVGIRPEDQVGLFKRFGRVQRPETAHVGGTGLGLYLSRELARMHGVDIACTSRLGSGSTFTLRLAMAGAAPARGARPRAAIETRSKRSRPYLA